MAQAKITVNAVVGSNAALPINTSVALNNINGGSPVESSYAWTILDQPPGTVDALSATNAQSCTFTPRKEGTYLLRLIVNQGLPSEQEDRVIVGIRQLKTLERIPAAGETTEADTVDGWATATNSLMRRLDRMLSDPGVLVGCNSTGSGSLARGRVVRSTAAEVLKSGLYGQETVPGFTACSAATLAQIDELLCAVEYAPDGVTTTIPGTGAAEARLMQVRYIGRLAQVPIVGGTAVVGDTIYVNDSGALSLTQGTIRRRVGSAMTAGTTIDVWFNGVGGADVDLTPINAPFVAYGPSALSNPLRVDGANATSVTNALGSFTIKAGDSSVVPFVVKGFTGSTQHLQDWQTGAGAVVASVLSDGTFSFSNVAVSGTLTVTGLSTFNGAINANATLSIVGATAAISFNSAVDAHVVRWLSGANPLWTIGALNSSGGSYFGLQHYTAGAADAQFGFSGTTTVGALTVFGGTVAGGGIEGAMVVDSSTNTISIGGQNGGGSVIFTAGAGDPYWKLDNSVGGLTALEYTSPIGWGTGGGAADWSMKPFSVNIFRVYGSGGVNFPLELRYYGTGVSPLSKLVLTGYGGTHSGIAGYMEAESNSNTVNIGVSGNPTATLAFVAGNTTPWTIDGATGALNASGGRYIHNLLNPVSAQDAATKDYADHTPLEAAVTFPYAVSTITPAVPGGTTMPALRYYKDTQGVVRVAGAFQFSTTCATGTVVGTMPAGYRPDVTFWAPVKAMSWIGGTASPVATDFWFEFQTGGNVILRSAAPQTVGFYSVMDVSYRTT